MSVKYAMVLDLDRCIGCYTCVVACKMAYGTKPGVNYNGVQTIEWGEYPNAKQRFLLTMCMHCENPSCVEACPAGATYKSEDGIVHIDYDKCIGCGYCVQACPYGQRHLVNSKATSFPGVVASYEEENYELIDVVEKCSFCSGRVAAGEVPMCVMHCPGQCRIFGNVNDPNSAVSKYIKDKNAVLIQGTSIYYVLPEGMDASALPEAFKSPAFVAAVNKYAHPAGKVAMGAVAAALVGGMVLNAVKGGKSDE